MDCPHVPSHLRALAPEHARTCRAGRSPARPARLRERVWRGGQAGRKALVARRREGRAAHERVAEAVIERAEAHAADVELAGVPATLVASDLPRGPARRVSGQAWQRAVRMQPQHKCLHARPVHIIGMKGQPHSEWTAQPSCACGAASRSAHDTPPRSVVGELGPRRMMPCNATLHGSVRPQGGSH